MTLTKGTGRWFVISFASEESNQAVTDAPSKKKRAAESTFNNEQYLKNSFRYLERELIFC